MVRAPSSVERKKAHLPQKKGSGKSCHKYPDGGKTWTRGATTIKKTPYQRGRLKGPLIPWFEMIWRRGRTLFCGIIQTGN